MMTLKRLWPTVFLVLACAVPALAEDKEALMPVDEFLKVVREPFRLPTRATFTGKVQSDPSREGKSCTEPLVLDAAFNAEEMRGLIQVGDGKAAPADAYQIVQHQARGMAPKVELKLPEKPATVSIESLGLFPEDISFTFIYWDLLHDFKHYQVAGQTCRMLELQHPVTGDRVLASFSVKYGFPLRIEHYRKTENKPWRILEFKDFKEYSDDFWFIKEMVIHDPEWTWKTRVVFDKGEMRKLAPGEALPTLEPKKDEKKK